MSYYLYQTPAGLPEVTTYRLPTGDDFVFVRELAQLVDTKNMVFDAALNLVPREKSIDELRRSAYPKIADQLDGLWHAMNKGDLPRAEPFYSDILRVKELYPKQG